MSELVKVWPEGDESAGKDIEGCSTCGSEDPAGYTLQLHRGERMAENMAFCNVCYRSLAGNIRAGKATITIAQCTNMILRRLEAIEAKLAGGAS